MKNKSIIAQVDKNTEKIMNVIANDISEAINEVCKNNDEYIKQIADKTDSIIYELGKFDNIQQLLERTRGSIENIKQTTTEELNKLTSAVIAIDDNSQKQNEDIKSIANKADSISKEFRRFDTFPQQLEHTKNGIESIKQTTIEEFSKLICEIKEFAEKDQKRAKEFEQRLEGLLAEANSKHTDSINQLVNIIKRNREDTQEELKYLNRKTEQLFDCVAAAKQDSDTKQQSLLESIEKIQATLNVVINQTTPFWKKWRKK